MPKVKLGMAVFNGKEFFPVGTVLDVPEDDIPFLATILAEPAAEVTEPLPTGEGDGEPATADTDGTEPQPAAQVRRVGKGA
jgi:hypothetical protein